MPRGERGFTYLALLFSVAMAGIALAAVGAIWSTERQRDRERELLFVGGQFREAIRRYYESSPGSVRNYPQKLSDLLDDRRFLSIHRHLRRLYNDPMTGAAEWGVITAPEGGIMGVFSQASAKPLKVNGFSSDDGAFVGATTYTEWRFEYRPKFELGR